MTIAHLFIYSYLATFKCIYLCLINNRLFLCTLFFLYFSVSLLGLENKPDTQSLWDFWAQPCARFPFVIMCLDIHISIFSQFYYNGWCICTRFIPRFKHFQPQQESAPCSRSCSLVLPPLSPAPPLCVSLYRLILLNLPFQVFLKRLHYTFTNADSRETRDMCEI